MDLYSTSTARVATVEYDEGLRKFMLGVFNNMSIALAISGLVSLGISMSPVLTALIWGTAFKWVAIFAPLAFSLLFGFTVGSMTSSSARLMLYAFSAVMGLSLSSIFLVFKLGSIAQVFFITAATFGSVSIWGYTTKRDLSAMGSFLMMGVIGLVIAGVVNLFLQSAMMSMVISGIAVLVFTALTAFDVQNLKTIYDTQYDEEMEKSGVVGAFSLYLNFINIFTSLLNLLGEKKE